MMITRTLYQLIKPYFFQGKAIIITGPRQTGKTTLLKTILSDHLNALYLNCDEPDVRHNLQNISSTQLQAYIGNSSMILIDEGQRIENIGITIKLMVDNIPGIQLIVTGSSVIGLLDKIQETLAGRKFTFHLYPFSCREMVDHHGLIAEKRLLAQRLIYGMYPDAVLKAGFQKEILTDIIDSCLYKDLLVFNEIRKPDLLSKLLIALALQLGKEVSYLELANTLKVSSLTVEKYIDLLEKVFVLFKLSSYSQNLRNELKKSKKIYFWDNGIRNALLGSFQPVDLRTDTGALWENYVISERLKYNHYAHNYRKNYFWRTRTQQEIDLIETTDEGISGYEIKWKSARKTAIPPGFAALYPQAGFATITPENFYSFVMP